jgi:hypothetical protein
MVELLALGSQAGLDVAQTLSISQLSESHTEKLVVTGKAFDLMLPAITSHTTSKNVRGHEVDYLGENQFAKIHWLPPSGWTSEDDQNIG